MKIDSYTKNLGENIMILGLLTQISNLLKNVPDYFSFVDYFEEKNEIWFNFGEKTFILTIRELE